MENSPVLEIVRFALTVLFGAAAFGFYTLCGLVRLKGRRARLALADGIFWLVGIPAFLLFVFFLNGGQPRVYLLLGLGVGFGLPSAVASAVSRATSAGRICRRLKNKAKKLKKREKAYLQN